MQKDKGVFLHGSQELWNVDWDFRSLIDEIDGKTLVSAARCHMLYQLVRHTNGIEGDAAEVGVYMGGTARLISGKLGAWKRLYLFDTFGGMPGENKAKDNHHKAGDFSDTSVDAVARFLQDRNNVEIFKGVFPGSAPAWMREKKFAFVHIDVDLYQSTLDACSYFYPKMSSGGVMVVDDYGFPTCEGAKSAVDEFFGTVGQSTVYLATGQCMVIKR